MGPNRRDLEQVGYVFDRFRRQPSAVLALGQVEQRDDRTALPSLRIAGHDLARHLHCLGCEGEITRRAVLVAGGFHRSTSPNTTSRDPRMATLSASMWPRHI